MCKYRDQQLEGYVLGLALYCQIIRRKIVNNEKIEIKLVK